jgi:hypothetical protein
VLAIVEDWCGDVVANVPIVERLAKESGKLNVRYAQRDSTPYIERYLNRGQFKSIPVFVFLDGNFKELGVFYERPDSVTQLRADKRLDGLVHHSDRGTPSTWRSATPNGWARPASPPRLARAGTPTTTSWPSRSTGCARPS